MTATLFSLLLALAPAEQLTLPSLPKTLGDLVRERTKLDDSTILEVRRFASASMTKTLWMVGLPCSEPARLRPDCQNLLYLQHGKHVAPAGDANGALLEVDSSAGLPNEIYFYAGKGYPETKLHLEGASYAATAVDHLFRDPLTQERLPASEMRGRAAADLQAGNAAAAAGRYTLLCEAKCDVGDLEALASANLTARLFPQAETTLRAAVTRPGHRPEDWKALGVLLRAAGKNAQAEDAEAHFAWETKDAGPTGK